jgi:hypothetical protein
MTEEQRKTMELQQRVTMSLNDEVLSNIMQQFWSAEGSRKTATIG